MNSHLEDMIQLLEDCKKWVKPTSDADKDAAVELHHRIDAHIAEIKAIAAPVPGAGADTRTYPVIAMGGRIVEMTAAQRDKFEQTSAGKQVIARLPRR